ncbi:hypothetical protein FDP22_22220 (plasmid) [Paroceanicella profunda]|uniref:Uncharacterized protein n=1 Tax=Paroceanicella profunda TaxID=2579971 RepID=A0A5B8G674_9RHOB|nr:hypothetical protein [Paroceanicella profunda]QDL94593.1 hypothetical protein FDP22_22220 [Paroceanicella profunda]
MLRSLFIPFLLVAAGLAAIGWGAAVASPERAEALAALCPAGVLEPPAGYEELVRPLTWTCRTRAARESEMAHWLQEADAFFLRRRAVRALEALRSDRAAETGCGAVTPVCVLER